MKVTKQKTEAQHFYALILKGIEAWREAGDYLVAKIDENKSFIDDVLKEFPNLNREFVYQFERIGRKQLLPELLLEGSAGASRLAMLPYRSQVALYNKPIDVVVRREGNFFIERKAVNKLTPKESAVVFDAKKIRSAKEQQSVIQEREKIKQAKEARYVADGDGIEFLCRGKYTWGELEDIIKRHKPAAARSLKSALQFNQIQPRSNA
jgi:hypothetical protein